MHCGNPFLDFHTLLHEERNLGPESPASVALYFQACDYKPLPDGWWRYPRLGAQPWNPFPVGVILLYLLMVPFPVCTCSPVDVKSWVRPTKGHVLSDLGSSFLFDSSFWEEASVLRSLTVCNLKPTTGNHSQNKEHFVEHNASIFLFFEYLKWAVWKQAVSRDHRLTVKRKPETTCD